jgi:tripartite-type tricarboxylate transporter receptor subunit TctC
MRTVIRLAAAIAAAFVAAPAGAQPADSFYAGKTVKLIVGTGPGGGYDIYGRLLARHIGRHIPGHPTVVVVNMPGASSLTAANYLANVAPRDGSEMLLIVQTLPIVQVAGSDKVRFDLARFNWVGNMSDASNIFLSWHTSPVKTMKDAQEQELIMGSTTPSSLGGLYPAVANQVLGTKFKIINGYASGDAIDIALERGEVQGRAGNSWPALKAYRGYWIRDRLINVMVQVGLRKEADLQAVPLLTEFARDDQERQVLQFYSSLVASGRALATGPDVPADRVAALRRAFDAALADPALLAEAEKQGLELSPLAGDKVQDVVTTMVRTRPELLQIDRKLLD